MRRGKEQYERDTIERESEMDGGMRRKREDGEKRRGKLRIRVWDNKSISIMTTDIAAKREGR